jgi:hypothetical protein
VAFARHHGISYPTFASWIQKRRRERGLYPADKPAGDGVLKLTLAEVELPSPEAEPVAMESRSTPTVCAEIVLPYGLAIRVPEGVAPTFVVELVNALRSC